MLPFAACLQSVLFPSELKAHKEGRVKLMENENNFLSVFKSLCCCCGRKLSICLIDMLSLLERDLTLKPPRLRHVQTIKFYGINFNSHIFTCSIYLTTLISQLRAAAHTIERCLMAPHEFI